MAASDLPVPNRILDTYISLGRYTKKRAECQNACAFYLPGVLLMRGPEYWSFLADTYFAMAADGDIKTKKCLASSISEIAKIIGEEATFNELLPVF